MTRTWRKGCLCGCFYEEECRYIDRTPQAQVVHVVHHIVHHEAQRPEPEYVEGEVVVNELPESSNDN
jgi:hypothetical protein